MRIAMAQAPRRLADLALPETAAVRRMDRPGRRLAGSAAAALSVVSGFLTIAALTATAAAAGPIAQSPSDGLLDVALASVGLGIVATLDGPGSLAPAAAAAVALAAWWAARVDSRHGVIPDLSVGLLAGLAVARIAPLGMGALAGMALVGLAAMTGLRMVGWIAARLAGWIARTHAGWAQGEGPQPSHCAYPPSIGEGDLRLIAGALVTIGLQGLIVMLATATVIAGAQAILSVSDLRHAGLRLALRGAMRWPAPPTGSAIPESSSAGKEAGQRRDRQPAPVRSLGFAGALLGTVFLTGHRLGPALGAGLAIASLPLAARW